MAHKMLRKELIGKRVITEGGTEIGYLDDFVIESDNGQIAYMLIKTYGKVSPLQKTDEKGRLICSFEDIKVYEGHLVVR